MGKPSSIFLYIYEKYAAMKKLSLLLTFVMMTNILNAFDAQMARGRQLVPVTKTDISLVKEIFNYKKRDMTVYVDVYYEFYNPSDKVTNLTVGFEAPGNGWNSDEPNENVFTTDCFISDFRVEVNGQVQKHNAVPVDESVIWDLDNRDELMPHFYGGKVNVLSPEKIQQYKEYDPICGFEFPVAYYMDISFKPGVNIVRNTYKSVLPGEDPTYEHIYYIELESACRWANGQIDDFTLNVDFGEAQSFFLRYPEVCNLNSWKVVGYGSEVDDIDEEMGLTIPDYKVRCFSVRNGYVTMNMRNFKPKSAVTVYRWLTFPDHSTDLVSFYINNDYRGLGFDLSSLKYHDMPALTAEKVRILRNLPFAYRGCIFKSESLNAVYKKAKWYHPNMDYIPDVNSLTKSEQDWVKYWSNYKCQK